MALHTHSAGVKRSQWSAAKCEMITVSLQVWEVGAQLLGLAASIGVLKAIEVRQNVCIEYSKG